MVNFLERAIRLYEQEPGEEMAPVRLGAYIRRWEGWARAGLAGRWYSLCLCAHATYRQPCSARHSALINALHAACLGLTYEIRILGAWPKSIGD